MGQLYTYDVDANGLPSPAFVLTTFPFGMTIDTITGVIEWTPVEVGNVNVAVEASNLEGTDTQIFTINVAELSDLRIENLSLTSTSGNNLTTDDLHCG